MLPLHLLITTAELVMQTGIGIYPRYLQMKLIVVKTVIGAGWLEGSNTTATFSLFINHVQCLN